MTNPTPNNDAPNRTSGWEHADKVAHGAGKVISGTAIVLTKGWGVVLIIAGIAGIALKPGTLIIPGLLVVAYGVYLVLPGSKFVVW